MKKVFTLILAAGYSRRFSEALGHEQNKLLALLPSGLSVLEQTLRTHCRWSDNYKIVVNAQQTATLEKLQALAIPREKIVVCESKGMGDSLAKGIHATKMDADLQGWFIALADMPWLKLETLVRFKRCIHKNPGQIIRPLFKGKVYSQAGHPVYFPYQFRDELSQLEGNAGAKVVLERHNEKLMTFEVDDEGVMRDVDTPEDLLF